MIHRQRRVFLVLTVFTLAFGCAKAEVNGSGSAAGGAGGTPSAGGTVLPGLTAITVSPAMQMVTLMTDATGAASAEAMFTAQGTFADGHSEDVTSKVGWGSDSLSLAVSGGHAKATAPGPYAVFAQAGTIKGAAQLIATFSGSQFGAGFNSADATKFDGTAAAGIAVAYPLDRAIFPANFGPITVQVSKSGSQDLARLSFQGTGIDLTYFAKCEPGPGGGCYVTLPVALTKLLVAPSRDDDINLTVRLVSSAGGALAEATPIHLAWANLLLSGGLYYWTTMAAGSFPGYTPPAAGSAGTGIMRYNFSGDTSKPQLVYSDQGTPPDFKGSPPAQDYSQCIGCHAITPDGKVMALSVGGSTPSALAMLDIGAKSLWELDPTAAAPNATGLEALKAYRKLDTATFTTFGPKGDLMVNMYRGDLTLRGVTMSLTSQGLILPSVTEHKTDPFWSEDGRFFAFTTFADPSLSVGMYNPTGLNGDMKTGGQVWVATADASGVHDDAKVIVPRAPGVTSFYPAVSPDGMQLVYNQSTCSAGIDPTKSAADYGNLTCDGYDDMTATLWLTTPAGGTKTRLDNANGTAANSNSWPRWSPDSGSFRNGKLYWLAFSSRRPYGLQVNTGAPATTKPQLWFSAVLVGIEGLADPSSPPVWLPNQNPDQSTPNGNHVPQWVRVAVDIP